MNELSRHIESLLLTHECVAIPHFGTFMTMYVPAVHSIEEDAYYPPMRSVRFNADLKADDGLLDASICHTYGCTRAQARERVQTLVLRLRQQLLSDGQVDFGILGQFAQDEDGHISFEACQAGAITPQLYGLDSFSFPRLSTASRAKATHHSARAAMEADEEIARNSAFAVRHTPNGITIHIGHSFIRGASLVAAILMLFFLLPTHNVSRLSNPGGVASVIPINVETPKVQAPKIAEKVVAPSSFPEGNTKEEAPQVSKQETTPEVITPETSTPEATTLEVAASAPYKYYIVLASAISLSNAERYTGELQKRGMQNAQVMAKGKMVRVVLDGYASEEEAVSHLRQLRHNNNEFENAWVLHL